jgi:predicted CoA-binding protein
MQAAGFTIVPVNPRVAALGETILGEKVYASLRDVPLQIDIVDVFRPSEQAASVADEAAAVGAKALWLQREITSGEARDIAEEAGMAYVEDNCIAVARARHGVRWLEVQ